MNKNLQSIKKKIQKLRAQKGKRVKIPKEIWMDISKYSKESSLKNVCEFIGIDANNASRSINKLKPTPSKKEKIVPQIVQLPSISSPAPVLELALGNGTVVRVFSS